jgi:hypothetical protein
MGVNGIFDQEFFSNKKGAGHNLRWEKISASSLNGCNSS